MAFGLSNLRSRYGSVQTLQLLKEYGETTTFCVVVVLVDEIFIKKFFDAVR